MQDQQMPPVEAQEGVAVRVQTVELSTIAIKKSKEATLRSSSQPKEVKGESERAGDDRMQDHEGRLRREATKRSNSTTWDTYS